MANYHVVKNTLGGWDAKKERGQKASGHYYTQREAEQKAKIFAGNSGGGEVRIHSVKGQIRDSDTVPPGYDPSPPRDNKH